MDSLGPLVESFTSPVLLPIPIFAALCLAYAALAPFFSTERKRAYILSVLSSAVMSAISLPYVCLYLRYGLHEAYERAQTGWLDSLGKFAVTYFGTYLVADLSVGYFIYPSQIGLLTGWIHHSVYIALMIYCSTVREWAIFVIGAVMEIPTLDLGLSNLFPQVRNDLRFLTSFFVIRIALNLFMVFDCSRSTSRDMFDNAWMPTAMLSLALLLHVMWFKGGVTGYLRRHAKTASQPLKDPVMKAADRIDSTVDSGLPDASDDPALLSPEDSPIITPHTPSTGAVPLRDSLFFSNLPALPNLASIPNLGHLPTVSMPNLPSLAELTNALHAHRENINFGFKDAVKMRIGEQRDRFAGLAGARGINLPNFGNLGLRRRQGVKETAQMFSDLDEADDRDARLGAEEVVAE